MNPLQNPDDMTSIDPHANGTGLDLLDMLLGAGLYAARSFPSYGPEYTAQYLAHERKRAATMHLTGFRRTPLLRFSVGRARLKFGAVYGVGTGLTGKCYALPTKDGHFQTLSLAQIAQHVRYFMQYAEQNPHQQFMVTKIGCGLAGHTPAQIGPMFHPHSPNVILPGEFTF